MLHHPPRQLEQRIAEAIRDAIHEHADAEIEAKRHPSYDAEQRAKMLSQRLWSLTPALLAIPLDKRRQPLDTLHTDFEIVEVVRKRLQKLETG
eukprot:7427053-Karenia_brevis.AAC.1